jgi:4-amino-4-deoxy-L-arabinose transferase-like glycosyltransferase
VPLDSSKLWVSKARAMWRRIQEGAIAVLTWAAQQGIIRGVMMASPSLRAWRASQWWSGRGLLVLVAVLAMLTLGALPLVDEDEGEYAQVAAELAHAPNWLAPTLNGQPFYEKPILLFWLQAPLVWLVGPVEWAFRLPSAVCTLLWLLALSAFLRPRGDWVAADAAVWLAATSAGIVVVGRAATMDAPIILLLTLTLLDAWRWLEYGRVPWLRRAAVWAALGMLAKGPVALVIPAAVLGSFLLVSPAARARWRGLLDPWAWLILLTMALPWYAWYGWHSDGEFLRYFLLRENAGRLGGSLQGHGGSPLYYLAVLPLLLLPHGSVLAAAPRALRDSWQQPLDRFLLLWFACVFLIFSLAGTKLPHYLLYGCTPLFLLGGRWLSAPGAWTGALRHFAVAAALILPGLALALPALAGHFALAGDNPYLHEMLSRGPAVFGPNYWSRAAVWALLALVAPAMLWHRQKTSGAAVVKSSKVVRLERRAAVDLRWTVIVPGLVSALGISLVLLPALTALQQAPVRAAARFAAGLGAPIVADNRMPSFSVYLGRPTQGRAVQIGDIAFGRLDHPDRLGSRHQILFAEGGVRVVRVLAP